ncbi:MAG: DUF3810 domain-containing protein, partial [Bacteroidota bacterium]
LDYTIGWLPFPGVFLVLGILLFFLLKKIVNLYRTHRSFGHSLMRIGFSFLAFLGGVIFFFMLLWGFNYGRLPLEVSMQLNPQPLTYEELQAELKTNTQEVAAARTAIPDLIDTAIVAEFLPDDLENLIRQDVEYLLERLGFSTVGHVRGRQLRPKGILLRFSTAGVYFPWTGESNIDAGLHPVQIPFTLAHEFAHGYGFTDEGICNFLAYLACIDSPHPMVRYAGHLGYWRYIASAYRRLNRDGYTEYFNTLPKGVVEDLYAIDDNSRKYPDILPELRDVAYDAYLKSQGVQEGLKSYSQIVMLVKAWREQKVENNSY